MNMIIAFILGIVIAIIIVVAVLYYWLKKDEELKYYYEIWAKHDGVKKVLYPNCDLTDLYMKFRHYKEIYEELLGPEFKSVESYFLYIKYVNKSNPKDCLSIQVSRRKYK